MTLRTRHIMEQIKRGNVPEGYKKTKAGIFPAGWDVYMIGDCLSRVERPVEVKPNELYTQIGIRSHGKGLFYKEPVTGAALGNKAVFWIEPDCFIVNIVFAWEQAIGKTTQSEVGMIGSHRFPMYRPVNDRVDIDYLISYFLTKRGTDILEAASPGGAGRNKTLGQDRFLKSKIILPPIEEQRKIATILTTQDKVIELKEKRLAEKQWQKKYLMHRFFVDANGKKIRLGQIANVIMGQSPSSTSYNEQMEGMPLIQGNGDIEGRNTHPRMYTTQPTKICKKGDILISVRAPVGSVSRSSMNACIGRGMCAVDAGIYQNYVYQYLIYFEDKWGKVSQGSTFESISGDEIRKLKTLIPDNMQHIEKILSTADREIDLLRQDIEQEKQKKKALMQLLLTGIVRVKT